jgi:hypothetical protein
LATDLKRGIQEGQDEMEDIIIKKFTLDDVEKMILEDEITDGPSIAALYKFLLYKKNNK